MTETTEKYLMELFRASIARTEDIYHLLSHKEKL